MDKSEGAWRVPGRLGLFLLAIIPRYPPLTYIIVLNSCYVELTVSTDAPTYTQYNINRIHSAYVTLTLAELPHSLGFMSTPKRYLS